MTGSENRETRNTSTTEGGKSLCTSRIRTQSNIMRCYQTEQGGRPAMILKSATLGEEVIGKKTQADIKAYDIDRERR